MNENRILTGRRGRKAPDGTRANIIRLTCDLIAAKGLSAVKARTIASSAGVSVGTVYNLFGPLDDLVRLANSQTYDALYAHQRAALSQAREDGSTPTEQLFALAQAYLLWVSRHHAVWSAILSFNQDRMETAPDWYRHKEDALLGIIEEALDDFPVEFEGDARLHTARALWASIHGIVSMAMGSTALLLPMEEIEHQMRIVVSAVAATLE